MRALLVSAVAAPGASSQSDGSSGSAGIVFSLIMLAALIVAGFWLWSLIEVLSWPRSTWDAAGLSRARWVMRILFLGVVGAMFYMGSPRRALRASYASIRSGG